MANAWDDFWGNIDDQWNGRLTSQGGQQSNSSAAKWDKMFSGNGGSGFSLNEDVTKPLGNAIYNPNASKQGNEGLGRRVGIEPQKAVNTDRLPGMGGGDLSALIHGSANRDKGQQGTPPLLARGSEPDPMDKLMQRRAQLEAMLDEDYTGDPEMDNLINEAYSSALANVGRARNSANENFQKSDANIAALSAGHVNTIKTDDLDAVKRIGGDLQAGYQKTFDTAHSGMEADRSAELEQRTAMLQRLGIQEAGLGEAGQGETEAMSRMTENQAGAMKQAQGYQAADEVRNNELASSQASAGVERRSALNKDLQGILGKLDESETRISADKAQTQLQTKQSGKSDFMAQKRFISDEIGNIDARVDRKEEKAQDLDLENRKLAQKDSGSGGVLAAVGNSLRNRGIDPNPYLQAYADVSATETFNAAVDGDKKLWLIRKMKAKNKKLDSREIQATVLGAENFGTDKL